MLFTNSRSQISYKNLNNNNNNNQNMPMMLSLRRIKIPTSTPATNSVSVVEPPKKKMKWGESHWNLFHTIAEKVRESTFPMIRKELLDTIYGICSNLPCPICANHAKEYLNAINFDAIQTKEQLKNLLFVFHNTVNQRRGVDLFPRDQLESKYQSMDLKTVITVFLYYFKDKQNGLKLSANYFNKSQMISRLNAWFPKLLNYCD